MGNSVETEDRENKILSDLRMNHAFGRMATASLLGAAISSAGLMLLEVAVSMSAGVFGLGALLTAILSGVTAGFLVFLIGFAASAAIGAPLYALLEKARIRRSSPYIGAGLTVGYIAGWIVEGRAPSFDAPAGLLALIPGAIIAAIFALRMRAAWRALEALERLPPGALGLSAARREDL